MGATDGISSQGGVKLRTVTLGRGCLIDAVAAWAAIKVRDSQIVTILLPETAR